MRSNDLKERMLRQPSRFWLVLSIVLLLAGLGFLGAFGHAQYQYGKSGRYYARLQQTAADPDGGIDFAALQAINPDAAAWLEMPGLGISLPVVQAADNETYLHRSFDGSDSPAGCLFFAAPAGDGLYRVIYGHNLHDGSMFNGLLNYRVHAGGRRDLAHFLLPYGHRHGGAVPHRPHRRRGVRRFFAAAAGGVGV